VRGSGPGSEAGSERRRHASFTAAGTRTERICCQRRRPPRCGARRGTSREADERAPTRPAAAGRTRSNREIYIDGLRRFDGARDGARARHDALLTQGRARRALVRLPADVPRLHAPGFLFASASLRGCRARRCRCAASARRARRLLFVLGVGYFLHLPTRRSGKTVGAATAGRACRPLRLRPRCKLIAVTQLFVLLLSGWRVATGHGSQPALAGIVIIVARPGPASGPRVSRRACPRRSPLFRRSDGLALPDSRSPPSCWRTLAGASLGRAGAGRAPWRALPRRRRPACARGLSAGAPPAHRLVVGRLARLNVLARLVGLSCCAAGQGSRERAVVGTRLAACSDTRRCFRLRVPPAPCCSEDSSATLR